MKANLLFLLCQKIWAHTEKRRGSQLALDIANFLWNSLLCGPRWYWVCYYFLLNSFLLFFCMYHFMFDVYPWYLMIYLWFTCFIQYEVGALSKLFCPMRNDERENKECCLRGLSIDLCKHSWTFWLCWIRISVCYGTLIVAKNVKKIAQIKSLSKEISQNDNSKFDLKSVKYD